MSSGMPGMAQKLSLPMISTLNGVKVGAPNAGTDMTFNFAQLIAHAAKSRSIDGRDRYRIGNDLQPGQSDGFQLSCRSALS